MNIKTFSIGPLMTNCYLVSDENKVVLIDAAEYDSKIVAYIKEHNLELEKILLTHAHFDHVSGAAQLAEEFGAPIVMGAKEEPTLLDQLTNGTRIFGREPFQPIESFDSVSQGDEINVGSITFTVIESPGHSIGGVAYYTPGHLFCGDSLFQQSIGRTDLPGGNFETLSATIRDKYYKLPDETIVYPGHGNTTSIGYEKKHNAYINER